MSALPKPHQRSDRIGKSRELSARPAACPLELHNSFANWPMCVETLAVREAGPVSFDALSCSRNSKVAGPREHRDFAWTLRLWVRRGSDESMQSVAISSNDAFRRNRVQTIFDLDQGNRA